MNFFKNSESMENGERLTGHTFPETLDGTHQNLRPTEVVAENSPDAPFKGKEQELAKDNYLNNSMGNGRKNMENQTNEAMLNAVEPAVPKSEPQVPEPVVAQNSAEQKVSANLADEAALYKAVQDTLQNANAPMEMREKAINEKWNLQQANLAILRNAQQAYIQHLNANAPDLTINRSEPAIEPESRLLNKITAGLCLGSSLADQFLKSNEMNADPASRERAIYEVKRMGYRNGFSMKEAMLMAASERFGKTYYSAGQAFNDLRNNSATTQLLSELFDRIIYLKWEVMTAGSDDSYRQFTEIFPVSDYNVRRPQYAAGNMLYQERDGENFTKGWITGTYKEFSTAKKGLKIAAEEEDIEQGGAAFMSMINTFLEEARGDTLTINHYDMLEQMRTGGEFFKKDSASVNGNAFCGADFMPSVEKFNKAYDILEDRLNSQKKLNGLPMPSVRPILLCHPSQKKFIVTAANSIYLRGNGADGVPYPENNPYGPLGRGTADLPFDILCTNMIGNRFGSKYTWGLIRRPTTYAALLRTVTKCGADFRPKTEYFMHSENTTGIMIRSIMDYRVYCGETFSAVFAFPDVKNPSDPIAR